ncbi:glycosyl hydrolase family 17 protein [Dyella tabacisoli]|uniref:Endo-1,3-beta-glucanase btgC n=1 Tax=Dyella tabacisoli TaxID=2282381 RepID=A0A369UKY7_9GAMM|nr:glycosyl hydrolase family 17 protein [Dyella tabacisoli]RDD80755.1 glycoside hydrolase family 17 [Dyella tabacisoli]
MPPQPSHSSRALWPAWLILGLVAGLGALWWWHIGRPVDLPEAPSARISCVSYAPFREPGETPFDLNAFVSPQRIDADLRALSQRFDCVRTYSQSHGLDAVPAIAGRYGMKVLMGIWLGRDAKSNAQEIKQGIATAQANPQVLRGVIVGNEVLLRGELSPKALTAFVREVRAAVPTSVPVTYADVWEFWLRYPQMAEAVDYLTIHILPYWEDEPVPPEGAVRHVAHVYARMKQEFPGREVMIGETGWPSAGKQRREASASVVNQARYMREFLHYAGSVDMPYNVIEAFDQPWKRAQEGTVGGYWGLFDVQAKPKFAMQGPVVEEPRWKLGWYAGAAAALLFALAGLWRRPWRGMRGWLALALAGFASGTALAWQARQMVYACRDRLEWGVSIGACLFGLGTAIVLARWIAGRLAGAPPVPAPGGWLRFGWLFVLALFGLLLVFDGRYRDFPLGLYALPCIGYALVAWLAGRSDASRPSLEERFLAFSLPPLAVIVVLQDAGLNPIAWLWLGLNLLIAVPMLIARRQAVRLPAQQA